MQLSEKNKIVIDNASELYKQVVTNFAMQNTDVMEAARKKNLSEDSFISKVRNFINSYYKASEDIIEEVLVKYKKHIYGYSILTDLISDPDISDIRCLAYDNIRIKKKGKRQGCDIKFGSVEEYKSFIDYITTRNHVNASQRNSIQRFTDDETDSNFILRFTLSKETTNTYDWPILVIRKVPRNFPSLEDLTKLDEPMMSEELKDILIDRFTTGSTIICGANSSGKTTILNALKEEIPEDVAVLVIQQADELTTKNHPDMTFMHSLPGKSESEVTYDLKDVSIAGLTMDVDFVIIGEVKGDEASDLLKASYSGQLCAYTIHAPNARAAINKTIDYALSSRDNHYTKSELLAMMDCFSTVIYMEHYKVKQVYAIRGYNSSKGEIEYYPIYENGVIVREEY